MNLDEQYSSLVIKEREDDLVPLMRSLSKEQRDGLVPILKKLCKEYLTTMEVRNGSSFTYTSKATHKQRDILHLSCFICLTRKEFEKIIPWGGNLEKKYLDPILDWYCPSWFNEYVNSAMPWHFKYDWVMELTERGFLTPSKELLARIIPHMIFEQGKDHQNLYKPENLEKRRITLEEHIWVLFELESTINSSDRYLHFGNDSKDELNRWIEPLRVHSLSGKINRKRLLRESILATTRNFNKTLSGWFAELFTSLDATQEELLAIQKELLNAFNSPHSKPVNAALNSLKKIVDDKSFDARGFLDGVPLLLASETKAVVASTLLLLDKVAKKHVSDIEEICIVASQAFIHSEKDIQLKAAKIIVKYGDNKSSQLSNAIEQYRDSLLMSTKNILIDFLTTKLSDTQGLASKIKELHSINPTEHVAIEPIESVDELIFLASQAFDNNKPYHIDLLPAALIKMQGKVDGSIVTKLEPALQRAYKMIMSDWSSTTGYLDHMLATFFIDYTRLLVKKYPSAALTLNSIHIEFQNKDEENRAKWPSHYTTRILAIETWITINQDTIYDLHKAILVSAYKKLNNKDSLPLLSTPTHEPCLIDPSVLIHRLVMYREAKKTPDEVDFQIAIARCKLKDENAALILSRQLLRGEDKDLFQFLLDGEAAPSGPFSAPYLWMVAGLRKAPATIYPEFNRFSYSALNRSYLTGQFEWKSFNEQYVIDQYNYQKKKNEKLNANRTILKILFDDRKQSEAGLKSILTKLVSGTKNDTPLIFESIDLKAQYLSAEHNDIERLLYLVPYNPEPILAQVIRKALVYNNFFSETDRKLVIKTLEALVNLEFEYDEMGHLFVSTCLLSGDKTVRSFAAEIWISGVTQGRIRSSLLGEILGRHESIEFAPLKRLTDVISFNLLNISKAHNQELEGVLSSMLLKLPIAPINNLKKLLEIFSEVISSNNSSVSESLRHNLSQWKLSSSLKKITTILEGKIAR